MGRSQVARNQRQGRGRGRGRGRGSCNTKSRQTNQQQKLGTNEWRIGTSTAEKKQIDKDGYDDLIIMMGDNMRVGSFGPTHDSVRVQSLDPLEEEHSNHATTRHDLLHIDVGLLAKCLDRLDTSDVMLIRNIKHRTPLMDRSLDNRFNKMNERNTPPTSARMSGDNAEERTSLTQDHSDLDKDLDDEGSDFEQIPSEDDDNDDLDAWLDSVIS